MVTVTDYPFEVRLLTKDEGGGYLISYPDFSDCISDGESIDEAIANGRDALAAVIATLKELGRSVPEPGSGGSSGKFVQRVPRASTQGWRLVRRAKA